MNFSAIERGADSAPNLISDPAPLFRPEVSAALSGRAVGAIRLAQPISCWLASIVSLAVGVALILFITFAEIEKKTTVTGVAVPVGGAFTVSATTSGTLKRVYVREGEKVERGQALFEIEMARQAGQGEISSLVAQQIRVRLNALLMEKQSRVLQNEEKARAIDSRLSNMSVEMKQLDTEITLMQQRRDLAKQTLEKFRTLETSGFVSSAQSQQKQEDLIDVTARIAALTRSKSQLRGTWLSLREERSLLTSELANVLAQLEREEGSLRQELAENEGRRSLLINASREGTISNITNFLGQSIAAGQVLATVVPNDLSPENALEAHLYAPSRTVGFVESGQRVYIRYQAFPYQKFGLYEGTIIAVGATPLAPNELQANLADTILSNVRRSVGASGDEGLYRIVVRLAQQNIKANGKIQPVKPGMTLEADIVQEKRRIWEWIFEPLLSMRQIVH